MEDDKKIDRFLDLLDKSEHRALLSHRFANNYREQNEADRILDRMCSKFLITRNEHNEELCIMAEFGYEVIRKGGWLKYLEWKKSEEIKSSQPIMVIAGSHNIANQLSGSDSKISIKTANPKPRKATIKQIFKWVGYIVAAVSLAIAIYEACIKAILAFAPKV